MNNSSIGEKAVKLAHFIKNAVKIAVDIAAQNYAGAAVSAVKILPQLIGIIAFLLIAPVVVFLCLPALLISNFLNVIIPSIDITPDFLQDNISGIYGDYKTQADDYLQEIKDDFNEGLLDPFVDYSDYGDNLKFDITRKTQESGLLIDVLWYATLHSVYFLNDPANITPEGIAELLSGILVYNVTEKITDVIKATLNNPITLVITRTLNIEFKEPYEIMGYFGFDEQQLQWAELMHSVVSGETHNYESALSGVTLNNPLLSDEWRNYITSEFGKRTDPIDGSEDYHTGIDTQMPYGADISAVMDGTVVSVIYGTTGYGVYVKIDHGGGIETLYAHCSAIYVTEEQEVKQGDVIAAAGSTGKSTGNHLHFEVRVNGKAINPRPYLM